jgi:hypothetical protein
MESAYTLGFVGFLRCAEFTSATNCFNASKTILLQDTVVLTDCVNINIKSSKTDPFRVGCWLSLFATGLHVCPVRVLSNLVRVRKSLGAKPQDPLLSMAEGSVLTRPVFISNLKAALSSLGLDQSKI